MLEEPCRYEGGERSNKLAKSLLKHYESKYYYIFSTYHNGYECFGVIDRYSGLRATIRIEGACIPRYHLFDVGYRPDPRTAEGAHELMEADLNLSHTTTCSVWREAKLSGLIHKGLMMAAVYIESRDYQIAQRILDDESTLLLTRRLNGSD